MSEVLRLSEWQTRTFESLTLTPKDRRLVDALSSGQEGRLFIEELRLGIRVRTTSWVGVVQFEHFRLQIEPKLAGDSIRLVEMIAFTTGLDALKRHAGQRPLRAQGKDLFELLALLFTEACEGVVRKGLRVDYVEREGELPYVRGRILADRQLLRRPGRNERIHCRYDELESDVPDNQLLAVALWACHRKVSDVAIKQHIRRLLAIFEEVCSPLSFDRATARADFRYDRLNAHYRDAHALAWLLLDGLGVDDVLASGDQRCFSFLIGMDLLFEQFIRRLIGRMLASHPVEVLYQRRDSSIIRHAGTQRTYSRVIPDLLVKLAGANQPAFAIDAKYKLYDERKLDPSDIYQTFLYAFAYQSTAEGNLPQALVLYPASVERSRELRLAVHGGNGAQVAEIIAIGVVIPAVLDELKQSQRGAHLSRIEAAVLAGLNFEAAGNFCARAHF